MDLKKILISLLILISFSVFAQVSKEQDELIETAENFFKKEQFREALPLYSQLLSLYPTEAQYSFYYGACLIENNKNIDKSIKYLSYAAKKQAKEPFVYYYLGRAYHLLYDFEKAIEYYNTFRLKSTPKQAKEKNIQREVDICNNGLQLVKYADYLIVLENNPTKANNFQYSYKLPNMGGKFVVKPEQFKTKADIKQKRKELLFVSDLGIVLFSSLGKNKKGSRDIYWSTKDEEGIFLPPKKLDNTINTKYDEIYPFLKADGKTLYFCSKGHNTMGGYDIFKSVYDSINASWSIPENLDFPINTPYDDLLYVIDSNDYLACFASNRETKENRLNIYKIEVNHNPVKRELNKIEDIKQVAKLNLTPLAEKAKIQEQSKKRAETFKQKETEEIPKQTFDFKSLKREQIGDASSYTKIINEDLSLLEKDKKSVQDKKDWFTQLANSKINQLSDLNQQMHKLEEKSPYTELSKNTVYLAKRKKQKKLKTESSLVIKLAEKLSKELEIRDKEIQITKLLLKDSTNNNIQDLVQNINANRRFIKENRKDTFSLKDELIAQKNEKDILNQQTAVLNEELKNLQADFKLALKKTKEEKEKYNASDEFEKDASRNSFANALNQLNETKKKLVKTEKEQIETDDKIEDLETEIALLEQLDNPSFDKSVPLVENTQSQNFEEILANSKQLEKAIEESQQNYILQQTKDKYENQTKTVVENPEALIATLNQEIKAEKALADNETSEGFENNFESNFEDDSDTEDNQPEDYENTRENKESYSFDNQNNNKESDKNIEETPNQATEKELEAISKEMITEVSLPNVLNFEARKLFQESARNQQLSDSLRTLSEQKASQKSSLKTEEEKEIFENEIQELNHLADIKSQQAKQVYQKALALEDNYTLEHPTDTLTDFLVESGELNFSNSEKASAEIIEYKTSVFKEHIYNEKLKETSSTITALEALMNRENISKERKDKLSTKLNQLKEQEQNLQKGLAEVHQTQNKVQNSLPKLQNLSSKEKEKFLLSSNKTKLSKKIIFNTEQLDISQKLKNLRTEIQEKQVEFKNLSQLLSLEEESLEEVTTTEDLIAKENDIKELQNQVWTQRNNIAELEQYANLLEGKILNQQIKALSKQAKTPNKAYQLEQESKFLSKKAKTIRKTIVPENGYNSFAVEMLEKANLYELAAINRQKSALNLYAELSEVRSKKNSPETPSLNKGIQLQPEEENLISEYETLYIQAEITEQKIKRVEEIIDKEQNLLENVYFDKNKEEQENRIASLKELRFNLQKELFSHKSQANNKKYQLNRTILSREIERNIHPETKSEANSHFLNAEFYQKESKKTLLDTISDLNNLKAFQDKKISLEEEAIKSQNLAFNAIYTNKTSDFSSNYSLVKINPLVKNDKVYKSDSVSEVSSDFILDKINLSNHDQKIWKNTEKLEEKKLELEQEYTSLESDIKLLKDSLNKVSKDKKIRNLNKQISKLEDKKLGYWSRISKLSKPIYQKRYQIYKNYIAQYRLKDNSLEAIIGKTLEKEANQAFRKSVDLRSETFNVSSFEIAYELLAQAGEAEKEALNKIERAFASYLDTRSLPVDSELVATAQETPKTDSSKNENSILEEATLNQDDSNKVATVGEIKENNNQENPQVESLNEPENKDNILEEVTLNQADTNKVAILSEIAESNNQENLQVESLEEPINKDSALEEITLNQVDTNKVTVLSEIAENNNQENPQIESLEEPENKDNILEEVTINQIDTNKVAVLSEIAENNNQEHPQVESLEEPINKDSTLEEITINQVDTNKVAILSKIAENNNQESPQIESLEEPINKDSTLEEITINQVNTNELASISEKDSTEIHRKDTLHLILKKIGLSEKDQEIWQEIESLEKDQDKLKMEYASLQDDIQLFTDSLNKLEKESQIKRIERKISRLETKRLEKWELLVSISDPINKEKYHIYKKYISKHRKKAKVKLDNTKEEEAGKAFKKATKLRKKVYNSSSPEEAQELFSEVQSLERESIEKMETSLMLYLYPESASFDSDKIAENLPETSDFVETQPESDNQNKSLIDIKISNDSTLVQNDNGETQNRVQKTQTVEIAQNKTSENKEAKSLLDSNTTATNNIETFKQEKPVLQYKETPIQVLNKNAYSDKNPISIDADLPDGIIYKIQIGAFSKPVPNDAFKGLTPVTGETRANSKYIRYFVGLFNTYEAAKVALPYVKQTGYQDAFIVAYKKGKKVPVYLARKENKTEQNYEALAEAEKAKIKSVIGQLSSTSDIQNTEPLNPAQNLSEIKQTIYTVQIGVYKSHISHDKLYNLTPLFNDYTASGLIRYTVGKFTDYNTALARQNQIRKIGIPDAFVTAYKNGKRISINQARKDLLTVRSISETPVVPPTTSINEEIIESDTLEKTAVNPEPEKAKTYAELYYSVQIGAFTQTVPIETVSSLIQISKEHELIHFQDNTNKTIYTIGKFKSLSQARKLKDELAQKGLTDAFIIALDGNKKVSIGEAQKVLEP